MQLTALSPTESLEKSYRLQNIGREQVDRFKAEYSTLFDRINEKETEENIKGHLTDFLKAVYYAPAHLIATKGKTDFVIHTGKEASTPAGVLFEVKRPTNKGEMVTRQNLNTKAMQELILYYFRERIQSKNSDIRHCVITNVYEWFIFDAANFERLFYRNAHLVKEYKAWASGQKVSTNNDLFYTEIAKPFLEGLDEELCFTYVDLRTYQTTVTNTDKDDDKGLLALYKLLSPTHLLKLPAATDSNTLNPKFYLELLHLIGLEEVKEGGKKVIQRKAKGKRDAGSLLENTIVTLEDEEILDRFPDAFSYGANRDEQLFTLALELCITWVNRILFLKLLESQLVRYHKDKAYSFLNADRIRDFDVLNKLFFQVLARKTADRTDAIQKQFGKIPYLNSSLFEISDLERDAVRVNSLDHNVELPLYRQSVLKDNTAFQHGTEFSTLHYLFAFLDAYDFTSESREAITEKNRTLINASVLGLIFEKINGYKDGSFYTPGFITEYMCHETIRRAVLQKFNDAKGWDCADFTALYNRITDAAEANTLINDIRICDPAVGSGHFLVSALNELIAVKSELGVLTDETGKRIRDYSISIVNDELVVLDEDGNSFEYAVPTTGKIRADLQRVQRTLFHQKQTLIENCLFGVDINPNSVKICRLRLWIELLKNAYYTDESGFTELETLPNIDINIKQGNSLLSRFSLTEDLSDVFKKQKFSLRTYKDAVTAYKEAKTKEAKAELQRFINEIKEQFRQTVSNRDPKRKKLAELRGKRALLEVNTDIFGNTIKDLGLVTVEKKRFDKAIEQAEIDIADVESNALYRGSFEWRFEFPEVLDEQGNYIGFDAVIGNPPYIRQEELGTAKTLLQKAFTKTYAGTADLYVMFIEHGLNILRPNGEFVYIIPNKWMRAGYGGNLRQWLKTLTIRHIVDFGDLPVFDEATTYPSILSLQKADARTSFQATNVDTLQYVNGLPAYLTDRTFTVDTVNLQDTGWLLTHSATQNLLNKLRATGTPLDKYVNGKIYRGVLTGLNEAFVIDAETKEKLIAEDPRSADVIKPFLAGRDIKRYQTPTVDKYVLFVPWHFPLNDNESISGASQAAEQEFVKQYPAVYNHLMQFKVGLSNRNKAETGKSYEWYALQRWASDYYKEFQNTKLMLPDIAIKNHFIYDESGCFCLNTAYIIPVDDKFLLGVLNSSLILWFYSNITSSIRGGYLRFIRQYLEQIPIPSANDVQRLAMENVVDQIIIMKATNSTADTSVLEAEIDQAVYRLFALTDEEISIIEKSLEKNKMSNT